MARGSRGPSEDRTALLAVTGGLLASALLVILATLVYSRADHALRTQAKDRVHEATSAAAQLVSEQTLRFSEIVASQAAELGTLSDAPVTHLTSAQRSVLAAHLHDLQHGTRGLRGAGFVSPAGRLLLSDPPNPTLYGHSFAFRDWFNGVTTVRSPYVSRVFRSARANHPKSVTVAALVHSATNGKVIGIVSVGLERRTQELAAEFTRTQGLGLTVTDQGGDVVAQTGGSGNEIVSLRTDPLVQMALAGRSGTRETDAAIEGYAPVTSIGWTVTARLPTAIALKDVNDLRTLVLILTAVIGTLLALLTGGFVWFTRRAQTLRFAHVKRQQATHLHDGVVQTLTVAQGARQAGDHETADKAVADALAESKRITAELLPDEIEPGDLTRPDLL